MTDEKKRKLEQKLWDIANTLRGKVNVDEFRDYILGFLFYKYLPERLYTRLYFSSLEAWKVVLLRPEEQSMIADALQTVDAKFTAVGCQGDKMGAFKKSPLKQMFV
ncbi:type I restriction-modification system subunit M N-terminal domain-containing protein [Ruegeria sp. MALMAid1280]|uniref:type I restriction-modification system subunit M N-terminal domain-containing protein n=1 Tax=Ruegeria sp. MALMAid1280 TaxID=3411634 RepID=UPI003BA2CEFF